MGSPRKSRRTYEKPLKPWDLKRIEKERGVLKQYGLRRKRELLKSQSLIRNIRRQAREIGAARDKVAEKVLLEKLRRLNLIGDTATIDDVLGLTTEDLLARRLQSILVKRGLANTAKQARQFITHGHVVVGDKRVVWPSFIVPRALEEQIRLDIEFQKQEKKVK